MRQIGAENDDPLKRIQAEINEVEKRERELREKKTAKATTAAATMLTHTGYTSSADAAVDHPTEISSSVIIGSDGHSSLSSTPDKDHCNDSVSAFSDDSGISSSSSPIDGQSANVVKTAPTKYVRSNIVQNTLIASSSPSSVSMITSKLTRTVSTPQIYSMPGTMARFQMNPAKKGLMQRFIATRGKIAAAAVAAAQASNNNNNINTSKGISNNFNDININGDAFGKGHDAILTSMELNRSPLFMMPMEAVNTPPVIERDAHGRPVRRGFVPVEEKIQNELRDLRSRESELKRLRRQNDLRQSQSDLLDCVDNSVEFDSAAEESDEEHCYMPAKLRSTKSIGELCDALANNSSLSLREAPSPQPQQRDNSRSGGMKPALSLAQLCDVDPDEAPSSHRLIAQWENIIQQNQ